MWIVCLEDESHEISSILFSKKKKKEKKRKTEMCPYYTDAPAQGHPHPETSIL